LCRWTRQRGSTSSEAEPRRGRGDHASGVERYGKGWMLIDYITGTKQNATVNKYTGSSRSTRRAMKLPKRYPSCSLRRPVWANAGLRNTDRWRQAHSWNAFVYRTRRSRPIRTRTRQVARRRATDSSPGFPSWSLGSTCSAPPELPEGHRRLAAPLHVGRGCEVQHPG